MTRIANSILFALLLTVASAAFGAGYSDLYVVPAVAHTHGAHGTLWRSDLVLHNMQTVPITVEMALVETGRAPATDPIAIAGGNETALHLNPGETRVVSDVVGEQGRDIAGALIVGADLPFVLTSRTYADSPSGRTLGQTVLPMAIGGSPDTVDDVSVLAGLSAVDGHRTNVGAFLAASRAPFVAEIRLLSSSGALLGSRLIAMEDPGFAHRQFSTRDFAAGAADVTAVLRVIEGDGVVVPYASTIDNATAEAIFVTGEAVASGGAAARAMLRQAVGAADR